MAAEDATTSAASGVVVAHHYYGISVQLESGEIGLVDQSYLAGAPIRPEAWPAVGEEIVVASIGRTSQGQLRLSSRPEDVVRASKGHKE